MFCFSDHMANSCKYALLQAHEYRLCEIPIPEEGFVGEPVRCVVYGMPELVCFVTRFDPLKLQKDSQRNLGLTLSPKLTKSRDNGALSFSLDVTAPGLRFKP